MDEPVVYDLDDNEAFFKAFMNSMKTFENPPVIEFLEKNIELPKKGNSEPGRFSVDRVPFIRPIYEMQHPDSMVYKTTIVKGAQLGLTLLILNVIAYNMVNDPETMLFVEKNAKSARKFAVDKLEPYLKANPVLNRLIQLDRSSVTKTVKEFLDGSINLVGACNADDLRSRSVSRLFGDECDSWTRNTEGQGLPSELAEARLRTFKGRSKIIYVSTPTFTGRSFIEDQYNASDVRCSVHTPCQRCGFFQKIEFENLVYDKDRPENVEGLRCISCKKITREEEKNKFLSEYKYIYDKEIPQNRQYSVGIHISSLYSPMEWYSWAEATKHYEDAMRKNDDSSLITLNNIVLGKSYAITGDCADWEKVKEKAEDYEEDTIPNPDILVLTCGVDVQHSHLEAEVLGITADLQFYSISYQVFDGQTARDKKKYWDSGQVWNDLTDFLSKTWEHPSGAQLPILMTMIDSGDQTSSVYEYCSKFPFRSIRAIKGRGQLQTILSPPRDMYITEGRNRRRLDGKKFQLIGTNILKGEIYGALLKDPPEPGDKFPRVYYHHPRTYSDEYFKQLCSNVLLAQNSRNGTTYTYDKDGGNYGKDEVLDCKVYARAAFTALKGDTWSKRKWDAHRRTVLASAPKRKIREKKTKTEEKPPLPKKQTKKSEIKRPGLPQSASDIKKQKMHDGKKSIDIEMLRSKNKSDLLSSLKKRKKRPREIFLEQF